MTEPRQPVETIRFVDQYCSAYQDLFSNDVRNFEAFKLLHLGLISEVKRKSFPALAKALGLTDNGQSLHHFVAHPQWNLPSMRHRRLSLLKNTLGNRPITLILDDSGDRKKGNKTDYVARQYLGKLGKIDNGIVSVSLFAVLDGITFPLLFQVYKPKTRLKKGERYQTKIEIALTLLEEMKAYGFNMDWVIADTFYGDTSEITAKLHKYGWKYVVAIKENHGIWMKKGEKIRYSRWIPFEREFFNGKKELRFAQEVIFGKRAEVRFFWLTTDPEKMPENETTYVMTNGSGKDLKKKVGNLYGMRGWIDTIHLYYASSHTFQYAI